MFISEEQKMKNSSSKKEKTIEIQKTERQPNFLSLL